MAGNPSTAQLGQQEQLAIDHHAVAPFPPAPAGNYNYNNNNNPPQAQLLQAPSASNYAPPLPAGTYNPPPQPPISYAPPVLQPMHGYYNLPHAAGSAHVPTSTVNAVPPANNEPWRTELFDCFQDPAIALMTMFFPCVTFGQIAEILDNGHTSCSTNGLMYALVSTLTGLPWILSCTYRAKLRSMFGLVESPGPDWMVHCLCECCAISQAYRELKLRGLDPSIGWVGNVAKQNQQIRMVPPTQQTMRT